MWTSLLVRVIRKEMEQEPIVFLSCVLGLTGTLASLLPPAANCLLLHFATYGSPCTLRLAVDRLYAAPAFRRWWPQGRGRVHYLRVSHQVPVP
jgi:hypothetical protein